jgi:signal transduction histidine kinase
MDLSSDLRRTMISGTKSSGFQRLRKLPLFWIVILSSMVSVLIIDAVLQYRWTKQLSEAAEARFGSTLQPLMIGWHLDFYGELSAICVALRVGPNADTSDNWNDYLHRYVDWSHASNQHESVENVYANPGLIKNIYIWETTNAATPRLLRLNPDAAKIELSSEPQNLQPLLARLRSKSSNLSAALSAWEFSGPSAEERSRSNDQFSTFTPQRSGLTTGWQFDRNIPAIVHPIVAGGRHSQRPNTEPSNNQDPVDWIVVVLNLDYIQNKVLPDLTKRDFSSREGLEYKLAVIATGEKPQVMYSSDPDFPSSNQASVDSRMNIFGPPPESVEGDFWQAIKNSESIRHEDWRSFSAPVWFPVFQYASAEEPWMLVVQHRTGPLEAIATSIWRRNLLTSSIVLLLLTCGMFLIVFATRRAQKLARLQLDFVASVSHELLTPLAAIYCTGENFMDGLVKTKEDSIAHGSIITSQARQLTDMVRQILLFASTQNGTLRYSLRPLDVLEILESIRKNVAMLVEGNGFVVEQQVQAGLPPVIGDLPALSHCVQNLILNAVKYSDKSRWIGISASIHEAKNRQYEVQICVKDRGTGISGSELPHIFEPFYRSPSAVQAQIHGTGLGLAVAKRIAQAMGGRLSVTSEVGKGSSFTLHLPVQLKSEREIAFAAPESRLGLQK